LVRGQGIKVELAVSPRGLQQAIQGGPQLVRAGRVHIPYSWERFRPGFYRLRAARSAVGITKGGKVMFVTADGPVARRGGITLEELAALMHRLGAVDAMNLDGGGSATLVVGGRTVSLIPRGGERNVTSLLVAVPNPSARVAPRTAP
jgi:exopolysaccharide biosynthesis protein